MKITTLSLAKINQNKSFKTQQTFKTNPLSVDTFQKSNVSFSGANDNSEDILDKIADDFLAFLPTDFLRSLSDEMIADIASGNFADLPTDLLDGLADDAFYDLLGGLSKTIRDYSDMVEYERIERNLLQGQGRHFWPFGTDSLSSQSEQGRACPIRI